MRVFRAALPVAVASIFGVVRLGAIEVPFFPKETIDGAFANASKISYGDIDGDGDLDVVAAAAADHDVSWFENVFGNGSFWTEFSVDVSFTGASSVEVVDLDGDGDLDILGTAFGLGAVHWWENDGTPTDDTTDDGSGNFWTEHVVEASLGGARSVLAADLDSDGHLDVLAAGSSDDDVRWWRSDGSPADDVGGDGNSWTEQPIDSAFGGAAAVFAADVDSDGDLDVLGAAIADDDVVWWENDGTPTDNTTDDGSGNFWTEHVVDDAFDGARSVYAADLDHDGDLDVLSAADADHDVTWWENDGDLSDNTTDLGGGAFWPEHTIDTDFMGAAAAIAVDLDGDADLDVLGAASVDDAVTWWESDGTPTDGGWTERVIDGAFDGPRWVAAADVNGDADVDVLAAAFAGNEIAWWRNDTVHRSALFPQFTAFAEPHNRTLQAADIDQDGDLDLVGHIEGPVIDPDDLVWWENTAGNGSAWTERTIGPPGPFGQIAVGDIDGDGDPDVLAAGEVFSIRTSWFENTAGDGSAWLEHEIKPGDGISNSADLLDLDRDGDLDVLLIEGAQLVSWWQNTSGDGLTLTEYTIDSAPGLITGGGPADIDGDGDLDVFGSIVSGGTMWWENDGDPTDNTVDLGGGDFWTEHFIGDGHLVSPAAAGDIDGDGDIDIVNRDASGFAWWENDGTPANGVWPSHSIESGAASSALAVADLDRDGDLDLVTSQQASTTMAWWSNDNGDGTVWTKHILDSEENLYDNNLLAVDLDLDGSLDLVHVHEPVVLFDPREIRLWWNRGGQFALETLRTSPRNFENGGIESVFAIEAFHRGRPGDHFVELTTFELLFEESAGDPLTTFEVNDLVESLFVYLDDGSGLFELGSDTLVKTVNVLILTDGVLSVALPQGNSDVTISLGSSPLYHVVFEATADAETQTPNSFRIVHQTENTSSADGPTGVPLQLEFASNVSTATMTAQDCHLLRLESAGGGSEPLTAPNESSGCDSGEYLTGEPITLTALPDEHYQVASWNGTDDDSRTTIDNTLTMPAGVHLVTIAYEFPDDLLIENESLMGSDTRKACSSIAAQTDVDVEAGAEITFQAPTVRLGDGFSVAAGGFLHVDTRQPVECIH